MRSIKIRSSFSILIILIILISIPAFCFADGSSLKLLTKSTTVTQGVEFRIVVELTTNVTNNLICFGPLEMSYDNSMFTFTRTALLKGDTAGFEYEPKSGSVIMSWSPTDGSSMNLGTSTQFVAVYFKGKKTGSGTFRITDASGFGDSALEDLNVPSGASIAVTVNPPVVLSSNNLLASLDVSPGTLSPAFNASTINYTMSVAGEVPAITVSATPADSKSSVEVTGNSALVDGDNIINIVVTAENDATRTYTITCNRIGPTPTPGVTVQLPGGAFTVIELPADTPIPTGFYKTLGEMDGRQIVVYKALKGELDLYYLLGSDGTAAFYYYNSDDESYYPFVVLTLPAQPFNVLIPGQDVLIPSGFSETTTVINGQSVQAWQRQSTSPTPGAGAGEVLLYLMDSRGIKGFYLYDSATQALTLFEETVPEGTTVPTETGITPTTNESSSSDIWMVAAIILLVLCLGLAGVVVWMVIAGKGGGGGGNGRPEKIKAPKIQRV